MKLTALYESQSLSQSPALYNVFRDEVIDEVQTIVDEYAKAGIKLKNIDDTYEHEILIELSNGVFRVQIGLVNSYVSRDNDNTQTNVAISSSICEEFQCDSSISKRVNGFSDSVHIKHFEHYFGPTRDSEIAKNSRFEQSLVPALQKFIKTTLKDEINTFKEVMNLMFDNPDSKILSVFGAHNDPNDAGSIVLISGEVKLGKS